MPRRHSLLFHPIVHERTSSAEAFKWSVNQRSSMDDVEHADASDEVEPVPTEVLVDEDRDDILEEMTLEQREEALKRSRWNVFMFLGIAVIVRICALPDAVFRRLSDVDWRAQATKDVGLIWGMPIPGDDITDVPVRVDITIDQPPPTHSNWWCS